MSEIEELELFTLPQAEKVREKKDYEGKVRIPKSNLGKVLMGFTPEVDDRSGGVNENELISYGQNPKVLKSLLSNPSVNPLARNSMSLRVASKMGMLQSVKMLLNAGCDPSSNNNEAIIWAAENGYDEIVLLLIRQYNTDPSDQDNKAYILASKYKHLRVLEVLLADTRVVDKLDGVDGTTDEFDKTALNLIF